PNLGMAGAPPRSRDIDDVHQPGSAPLLDVVVRRVAWVVGVDQPFAGTPCRPDDVIALARPDIDSVGKEAGRSVDRLAVAGDQLKRPAMDMHRMDEAVVGSYEAHLQVSPTFMWIVSVAG